MKEVGVYIGRLNPAHNGHLGVINKLISENEQNLLLLGTPLEREPDKNPLSFEERKDILRKIYPEKVLKIVKKEDNPKSNLGWVLDIYRKIKENFPEAGKVNFYYGSDDDSAFTVLKENLKHFYCYDFDFIKVDRLETFIEHNGQKLELSATNFRKYLREGNINIAKKFTDERIFEEIKKHFLGTTTQKV